MDPRDSQSPVVIPPLKVRLKSGIYTYSSSGLMRHGHKFDDNVAQFLPPLEPVRTKTGKVKVHQPHIQKKPVGYWKAQCAFRNLSRSGTIAALQKQLRKARGVGMDVELVKVEKKLKEEFWTKNAQAMDEEWDGSETDEDEKWDGLETDEQKAEVDPDRFLRERFPIKHQKKTGRDGDDGVVVLKSFQSYMRHKIHTAASPLGLCDESVNAPIGDDGRLPTVDKWMVLGRNRSAVNEEIQKVSREAARMRQRAEDAHEERTRKLHETVVSNVMNSQKKSAKQNDLSNVKKSQKKSTKQNDFWDVAGSWTISCPYVDKNWGSTQSFGRHGASSCSLDIRFTESSPRGMQMWAKFDFIAITGVFRFVNPSTPSVSNRKSKSTVVSWTGVTVDDDDCGYNSNEDVCEDDDESCESLTPEEFYLGINDKPSPSCPQWNFRWRGEETGEGEIELYSDEKLCSMTFGGTGGTELTGSFKSDLTGKIKFTGRKTGPSGHSSSEDPDDEWRNRSESAHESARVGRWG